MKRKISRGLIGTAALAILMTLLLTAAVCYNIFKNQVFEDLKGYARMAGLAVTKGQERLWDEVVESLKSEHIRITLIGESGNVLFDTEADTASMESHDSRPEIQSAFGAGEGNAIRQSRTLNQSTYYYAVKLDSGQVLRLAKDADSIYRIVGVAVPYILIFVAILFAVCCISSCFLAEGIMRPVKMIARNVENIEKIEVYEELMPYMEAIKSQHDDVLLNAQMRQEFTANVSHELKTPLAAISGYAELIENGMAPSESETKRFAGEIHSNANRLLTLINDIIRLSQLDADSGEEEKEPVNLKEIAETCVNMLQMNAEKHRVSLTFEGESVLILSTRQMTEELVYNLCDNAIRYNKEGGSVHVMVKDGAGKAVLTVKDTGIGIPKEHQDRIFERFYRVDKSRSKSMGGTGLGLAIVKHILPKAEADLSLESREGVGTRITVTFPVVNED